MVVLQDGFNLGLSAGHLADSEGDLGDSDREEEVTDTLRQTDRNIQTESKGDLGDSDMEEEVTDTDRQIDINRRIYIYTDRQIDKE